jgi:hypothetical protein
MAKIQGSDDNYTYFKKAKWVFGENGQWTIDGRDVNAMISLIDADQLSLIEHRYNVSECRTKMRETVTVHHEGLYKGWVDLFFIYVESAIFCDAFEDTIGNEKAKDKAAHAAIAFLAQFK